MRAEINVLGPLEVVLDDVCVVPTAGKPRQLLALLAINAGRVVRTSALMEELWGTRMPRSAAGTLQTYVLQVRRQIRRALPQQQAEFSHELLATTHTGYSLRVEPESVDAVRYGRLSSQGRTAGQAGDYAAADRLLGEALAVWRGPVLVDVPAGPQLEIETTVLAESRLTDLTLRIDAALYLGRHQQLLGELAALCARHPYMENFHAQHMLALYRSGRPGEALEAYQAVATTIHEQFGVDPSPRLRHLHHALLAGDALLDEPRFMVNNWTPDAVAG
jgi:SARP family transcriptional regulator, regulator of embCAB operon